MHCHGAAASGRLDDQAAEAVARRWFDPQAHSRDRAASQPTAPAAMGGAATAVGPANSRAHLYQGHVTPAVILMAMSAASGGLLFGYDNGITGAPRPPPACLPCIAGLGSAGRTAGSEHVGPDDCLQAGRGPACGLLAAATVVARLQRPAMHATSACTPLEMCRWRHCPARLCGPVLPRGGCTMHAGTRRPGLRHAPKQRREGMPGGQPQPCCKFNHHTTPLLTSCRLLPVLDHAEPGGA
jgi:hypothetical protein